MLVLNLACEASHAFEGWFASADDCREQQARGVLTCPMCGSAKVERRPSAPRLNVSHLRNGEAQPAAKAGADSAQTGTQAGTNVEPSAADLLQAVQTQWLQISRALARQSEDVGERFAEEARRIHYGDAEDRAIRGRSRPDEVRELLDEGIALMPLLLPEDAGDKLH